MSLLSLLLLFGLLFAATGAPVSLHELKPSSDKVTKAHVSFPRTLSSRKKNLDPLHSPSFAHSVRHFIFFSNLESYVFFRNYRYYLIFRTFVFPFHLTRTRLTLTVGIWWFKARCEEMGSFEPCWITYRVHGWSSTRLLVPRISGVRPFNRLTYLYLA